MEHHLHDYELLYLIRANSEEAMEMLLQSYHRVVWAIVHEFDSFSKSLGIHQEDMYQEGMCGLVEAIDRYNEELNVPFRCFARLCIERNIRSLIRKHRGLSYGIISRSLSLDMSVSEGENLYLRDTITNNIKLYDPVYYTEYQYKVEELKRIIEEMSEFEQQVFELRDQGLSYAEIAQKLKCVPKAVDNAIQRIKKKLASLFD